MKGDYISKYTKDQLPKCPGPETCPLKIKHPENGDEYSLGCEFCNIAAANANYYWLKSGLLR